MCVHSAGNNAQPSKHYLGVCDVLNHSVTVQIVHTVYLVVVVTVRVFI